MSLTVTETDLDLTAPDLVAATGELVPRLRELAAQNEGQRRLDDESLKILCDAGIWRAVVPKKYGGLDLSLADQIAIVAQLGRADGSLSWVNNLWLASARTAAQLPDRGQDEVFAVKDVRISGVFQPTGSLTPVDGGYLINGAWKWNTGCRGSDWDGLTARLHTGDGPPELRYCVVPTSELTIADDWYAFAATATDSSEVRAKDVFVPHHRTMAVTDMLAGTTGDRSNTGATGRNYPFFPTVLTGGLGTYLGIAQGAYELFLERLPGRGITYTSWTDQSASPVTQIQVATAANKIDAAKALAAHAVRALQAAADRGEVPSTERRAAIRGNCGYVTELCRQAVQELYQASGASVIMLDVPFQRFFRDIQGLSQHAAISLNTNLEVHGRVEVGLDPGTPFI